MANVKEWTAAKLQAVNADLAEKTPADILCWALNAFGQGEIALACSFGAEDVALVDMIAQIRPGTHVFYLDTDVLFPETYQTRDRIAARYDVHIVRVSPLLTLEQQATRHGDALWSQDPDQCCSLRKVEPLRRVLGNYRAWITGIRREQAPTRANAPVVSWDEKFALVKINPLAAWTTRDVWQYIHTRDVPYNPLHDQNYPSIGCRHCTRPVAAGEDPRAGRWSQFGKTECGLHK